MNVVTTIKETKKQINKWKKNGCSIGFVPTMGFLHEGHLSLINRSVYENDKTVVSIFVNPTQFSPSEDLESYPKDFETDSNLCRDAGVDLIFYPEPEEIYPKDFCTYVDMNGLTEELCGRSRLTHFRGVCTIVAKLFNIVQADRAYFGQKDAQQLAVISRMVRDLNMDAEVIACPTVREPDGLAKSSRNSYLSPKERVAAKAVCKAVFEGSRLVKELPHPIKASAIKQAMENIIKAEPLAKIDYVELVNLYTLEKTEEVKGPILCAVAVYIGKTRLIDNFIVE